MLAYAKQGFQLVGCCVHSYTPEWSSGWLAELSNKRTGVHIPAIDRN